MLASYSSSSLPYLPKRWEKKSIEDRASTVATAGMVTGAFISPKLGSSTPLLRLTNRAFNFAINFTLKISK